MLQGGRRRRPREVGGREAGGGGTDSYGHTVGGATLVALGASDCCIFIVAVE